MGKEEEEQDYVDGAFIKKGKKHHVMILSVVIAWHGGANGPKFNSQTAVPASLSLFT